MNFTTKHESNVAGIRRSVAKRPRRLWIVVSTLLRIPFFLNITGLSYKSTNKGYNICVNWKNSITGLFKE